MTSGMRGMLLSRRNFLKTAAAVIALGTTGTAFPVRARGAGASASRVTLTVWSSPDNADALADIARRFSEIHPDINITVTPISWEVLYPRMLADVASRTGAFDVATWDVQTAGAVAPGFVDLAQFHAAHGNLGPGWNAKDFPSALWQTHALWRGKQIGVPFYNGTMLFYYRKDYFSDPAIKAAFRQRYNRDLTPPRTWQEAVDVAKFFTRQQNPNSPTDYGIALMFPRTHTLFYMYLLFFTPYRRSSDGLKAFGPVDLDYGDYFTWGKRPAFANREGVKALEDMRALLPYSPDPLGSDYGETLEYFSKGTVAMVPQWTAVWASFRQASALQPIDRKVGVAGMPSGHSVAGGWALWINIASKHKTQAFQFLQFATNAENDRIKWQKYGVGPCLLSTLKDPALLRSDPQLRVMAETIPTQGLRPRIPQEPKLEDVTVGVFSEMLAGRRPITVGELQNLARQWDEILRK